MGLQAIVCIDCTCTMLRVMQICLFLCGLTVSHAWWNSSPSAGGACYAPPFVFGGVCSSSTSIIGSPGWKVRYVIEPTGNVPSLLCCEARGCGSMYQSQCSRFGMYSIGCANGGTLSATLPWGNNIATPAIRCKGTPTGMNVRWSH